MRALRVRVLAAFVAATVLAACSSSSSPAVSTVTTPAISAATQAQIDALAQSQIDNKIVPGLELAIGYGDQIVYAKGFGVRDLTTNAPMTPDTPMTIASVSKQFAAATVLSLVRDGVLDLDAPLSRVIPEVSGADNLTLRILLTQIGGLSDNDLTIFASQPYPAAPPIAPSQVIANFNTLSRVAPVSSRFLYANINYYLAALTAQRAGGTDYGTLLANRIFGKAGMTQTYRMGERNDPSMATGYMHFGPGQPTFHCDENAPSAQFGHGDLVSTSTDLLRWDAALRAGRVLDAGSLATMFAVPVLPRGAPTAYAMGWDVLPGGLRMHNGALWGVRTANLQFPEGWNVVVLGNVRDISETWNPEYFAWTLASKFLGTSASAPPTAPPTVLTPGITSCQQASPFLRQLFNPEPAAAARR